MSEDDLMESLEDMLGKSLTGKFKTTEQPNGNIKSHLAVAAEDMGRFHALSLYASLTLESDKHDYLCPTDLLWPSRSMWGDKERHERKPWDSNWPGRRPRLQVVEMSGTRVLFLDPAPTAAQIADLGATYNYMYRAAHIIDSDADKTTIQPGQRNLLLIRALSQSLTVLANMGVGIPVQLGDGVGSMAKNGTPAALAKQALDLFEEMAA